MIKIEILNKVEKKKEFLVLIRPEVIERVSLISVSLKHLDGERINVNIGKINKYRFLTRKLLNKLIKGDSIKDEDLVKSKYKTTVEACIGNRKKGADIENVNFRGLQHFLKDLVDIKTNLLNEILVCEASILSKTNYDVLKKYEISGKSNEYILKLIFDYSHDNINKAIKGFFRQNNFVNYCPYCNLTEVKFVSTSDGKGIGTTHQLDHFFDKARYPLLACSFFNLVPSDATCNGSGNKGSTLFTDEFHLNPYIRGFKKDLTFYPLMKGNQVNGISVQINPKSCSKIRQQILGSSEEICEGGQLNIFCKEGNANVFNIKAKYKERCEDAQWVLDSIRERDNGSGAIKNYIKKMKGLDINKVYFKWYKRKIRTSFEPKKFNDRPYSKFNRDIHDHYYILNKKKRNQFIRDIIE